MNLKERYQAAIKRLEEAETSEQVEQAKAELAVLKEAMDAAAEARAQLAGLAPASPKSTMAGQAKGLAFGGSNVSMAAAFFVYCLIGAAMTAFFSLSIFDHPCKELMALGARIAGAKKK